MINRAIPRRDRSLSWPVLRGDNRQAEILFLARGEVWRGGKIGKPGGTTGTASAFSRCGQKMRRGSMPVLLLWAVPAVIVVGGAGYWLVHMH
jgi:hypothetical protein